MHVSQLVHEITDDVLGTLISLPVSITVIHTSTLVSEWF